MHLRELFAALKDSGGEGGRGRQPGGARVRYPPRNAVDAMVCGNGRGTWDLRAAPLLRLEQPADRSLYLAGMDRIEIYADPPPNFGRSVLG